MSIHGLRLEWRAIPALEGRVSREEDRGGEASNREGGAHQSLVPARLSPAQLRPARQRPLQRAQEVRLPVRLVGDRASRRHTKEQHAALLAAHARLSAALQVSDVSDGAQRVPERHRRRELFDEPDGRVDRARARSERRDQDVSESDQGRDRR